MQWLRRGEARGAAEKSKSKAVIPAKAGMTLFELVETKVSSGGEKAAFNAWPLGVLAVKRLSFACAISHQNKIVIPAQAGTQLPQVLQIAHCFSCATSNNCRRWVLPAYAGISAGMTHFELMETKVSSTEEESCV